jgi:hypothetical protein
MGFSWFPLKERERERERESAEAVRDYDQF